MKYSHLPPIVFTQHRQRFMAQLKSNSIAVFNSNDIYPISADSTLPFEQHRDLFYLSGIDQEETILVLCPDAKDLRPSRSGFCAKKPMHISLFGRDINSPKLKRQKSRGLRL